MIEEVIPTNQPAGTDHQIPVSPICLLRINAVGILINQSANRVMNMGIKVSPAPRITPLKANIVVKIR